MENILLDVFSTKSEREFTKGIVWIEFAKGFKLFRKGQGNRVSNCLPRFKLPEVDEERYIISMPGWNPQWTGRIRGTLEEGGNFSASAAEFGVERVARYQELSDWATPIFNDSKHSWTKRFDDLKKLRELIFLDLAFLLGCDFGWAREAPTPKIGEGPTPPKGSPQRSSRRASSAAASPAAAANSLVSITTKTILSPLCARSSQGQR